MKRQNIFCRLSKSIARATGHPSVFVVALLLIVAWAAAGPFLHFNDSWQLSINTATTIITFLMVFLIQSTQNRDTQALQVKLDELIRATEGAHNALLDLEELAEEDLDRIQARYLHLARLARAQLKQGLVDTGHPETPRD